MSTQSSLIYRFGPFELVPAEKQLRRDGQSVPLTPKAFDLLLVLVENAGHLMQKGELMNQVWPDSFVEEGNLTVKMSELRRVLNDGSEEGQFIETVPRRGYRFVAQVEGGDKVGVTDVFQSRPVFRIVVLTTAGLLLIGAFVVGFNLGGTRDRIFATAVAPSIRSIAVLPLENLSNDPTQDYFADGMTESLITDLAKIGELRVMSRASVMQFKGTRRSLSEIGRELNVDALLTGSVIRAGDRVRISVQLIHAATDSNLWTNSYERDLRDVLALQNDVTRDVVGRIRVKLTSQDTARNSARPTVNPDAYDNYLRGKFYLHRQTKDDNETAIAALENAVTIDPEFAAAHAELSQAYVWKLFLFDPGNEAKWSEKAFLSSEKALALDPNLAVAYLARGRLLWTPANHFPHDKAIQEYRKALTLDPNLDEARNQLALVYSHVGAFDDALRELQSAVMTNPSNSLAQFRIGETLLFQGKYEEALNSLRNVPTQANPALVGHQVAWALFNLGRKEEAKATLDQFIAEHPQENRALVTSIEAVLAAADGRTSDAEKFINDAISIGKGFGHFHHTAYHIAIAYARMNRPTEALKFLETAASDGFPCYPLFERDPNLDNIRNDPAFASFMSKLKQEWETHRSVIGS